jgi:hypothetical protein
MGMAAQALAAIQVGLTLKIEQSFSQGLELLQQQLWDLGGGDASERPAAADEETESDARCLSQGALLAAGSETVLRCPGVAQFLHLDIGDHRNLLVCEVGKLLHQDRQRNLVENKSAGEDQLTGRRHLGFEQDRQRDQAEQRVQLNLLGQLFEVESRNLPQEQL